MSFPLPQRWAPAWAITVTKCERNRMGGTDVECVFLNAEVARFTFDDYDVELLGFDGIRGRIEGVVGDLVADALRAAQ